MPLDRSAEKVKQFLSESEEAAEGGRLHREPEAEVQDRGPDLNEEVLAAAADALERGEAAALVTIVRAQRIDAAAGRRQDARLRRRPDGRHDRRRVLRERRVLEGARGDHDRPRHAAPLRPQRRFRAGERAHLRRADGRPHRADRASARSSTSSAPATSAGTSASARPRRRLPRPRRRRPREVRQPRALSRRRRSDRRAIADWLHAATLPPTAYVVDRHARPPGTTSRRCARWRRATSRISA